MKKLIFIRTAPYPYKQKSKSLYQSLDEIGLQSAQPQISKPSIATTEKVASFLREHTPTHIFCSEFNRSKETARLFGKEPIVASQLNEIRFSMNDFSNQAELPDNELESEKINTIRYNFSRVLLADNLQEKQASIQQRIVDFDLMIQQLPKSAIVICLSHGFIMKLYQNFYRNDAKVKKFKDLVARYDWTKLPFDFLEGFIIS